MKMLDRYIVRSFLLSTALCFVAMMAIRIVADLFVNMDEFAEHGMPFGELVAYITRYYGYNSFAYIIELSGVIVVAGAVFTIWRMNHTNELTAMLASGVSLHRVVWPIILCSMGLSVLVVLDREVVIPRVASELVRKHDEVPGSREFDVRMATDAQNHVWYAPNFRVADAVMTEPVVVIHDGQHRHLAHVRSRPEGTAVPQQLGTESGWVLDDAEVTRAKGTWRLAPSTRRIYSRLGPEDLERLRGRVAANGGRLEVTLDEPQYEDMRIEATARVVAGIHPDRPPRVQLLRPRFRLRIEETDIATFTARSATFSAPAGEPPYWQLREGRIFIRSGLTPDDLVLRRSSRWLDYLSVGQLRRLLDTDTVSDRNAARLMIHARVTEPINNLVMLLLGLPFILSRERNLKASATMCLGIVAVFFVCIHLCRYVALPPEVQAWLPLLIFGPIAAVMIDSVKT